MQVSSFEGRMAELCCSLNRLDCIEHKRLASMPRVAVKDANAKFMFVEALNHDAVGGKHVVVSCSSVVEVGIVIESRMVGRPIRGKISINELQHSAGSTTICITPCCTIFLNSMKPNRLNANSAGTGGLCS